MITRNRILLFCIVCIAVVAALIDLPRIPINIHMGKIAIHKTIDHITINWDLAGTSIKKDFNTVLGLDLKGGSELVLQANMAKIAASERTQALESAKTVIENRINLYGVSEPDVYTSVTGNDYKIVVDLAGVKNLDQAKQLLGQTADLEFAVLRPGIAQLSSLNDLASVGISGADLQGATVVYQNNSTTPSIQLNFKTEGLQKFSRVAQQEVGKVVYVLLDGQIISAPTIDQSLAGGVSSNPVITGQFTLDQAKNLVTQLDAGALPVPVSIIQENTVSATLGATSVNASLIAGAIGIVIVVLFMLWNYGLLGLFANCALLIYALLTYAIFKTIPVTLTLAGFAGFILSIGMAVDANILIFERTKEELRKGKNVKAAINLGFKRAWPSIRDSNISSLITTIILYSFGTSIIRGFALTLAIGVLVSLFTAVVVTRTLLQTFFVPMHHTK